MNFIAHFGLGVLERLSLRFENSTDAINFKTIQVL